MYKCEKCNREFKNSGAKSIHQKYCNGFGSKLDFKKQKQKEVCPKCGQRILASKQKHYNTCDGLGPRRLHPRKGYHSWAKGMTYEEGMIKLYGEEKGKVKAQEYKNNLSQSMIGKNKGKHYSNEQIEKRKKRTDFGIVKRSKNEIEFANLCKGQFQGVLTNKTIFNGWDADIILPNEKIAILWNGKWHYEKIMKNHSVEQVQNRDKIKINEIKNCGYTPYIIQDMGRYNKEFVKKQFNLFINSDVG